MKRNAWDIHRLFFWAILAFAAIVRSKGLSTGLPLHTLYGETDTFNVLIQILRTDDLNPHSFIYPGLAYYLYLPFLYFFYLTGVVTGNFNGLMSVPDASFIFVGRAVSALFGIATVYLVYRLGKKFSSRIALFSMAILAAIPQHIEFSHMLRPEIPAIFFAVLAHDFAFSILASPKRNTYLWIGLAAGASFSVKYNIGLPLLLTILVLHWVVREKSSWIWLILSLFSFLFVFGVTNPFLITEPSSLLYWVKRVDSLYVPGEDYYGRNNFIYYLEFLTRYNYNLPLMLFAAAGIIQSFVRRSGSAATLAVYPLTVFIWLCSFEARRTHGLLPLHPFLALWAAITLEKIWGVTRHFSKSWIFKLSYALLACVVLFWPYYRAGVQTFLLSKLDNRSKAEIWMTNQLPEGSRIALLQFHQIELDHEYFRIENFSPKDYLGEKDFAWFKDNGFDYVALSSGQYMRYFTEGERAEKYREYYLKFFRDGSQEGTLVLDLTTHPLLIPDYRVKIYSTKKLILPPQFDPAIRNETEEGRYRLLQSSTTLSLSPGYFSLELPETHGGSFSVTVKNLKLDETIIRTRVSQDLNAGTAANQFPFAIFPVKANFHISLYARSQPESDPNQLVQFTWSGLPPGLYLHKIKPDIRIVSMKLLPVPEYDREKPFLPFRKKEAFRIKTALINGGDRNIEGYAQAFLSQIGEPQPWKNFEGASSSQEFFLEPGQNITLDIHMDAGKLTGDHQLSCWIFTRNDLPFSPQNGEWFNKHIRVKDSRLGIHPIYNIPIP